MYGEQRGQTDALNERLNHLTYWGDYGGDIISRYHYTLLLENYPDIVRRTPEMYGQALELDIQPDFDQDHLREVIRFLAYFDPTAENYGDYPIYEEMGFSDFEFELQQKEMTEGWWAEYHQKELVEFFEDWDGNTLVPEHGTREWGTLVYDYLSRNDWDDIEIYFESADSLVVRGWDTEEVAEWLLERYAEELSTAGNPPMLDVPQSPNGG